MSISDRDVQDDGRDAYFDEAAQIIVDKEKSIHKDALGEVFKSGIEPCLPAITDQGLEESRNCLTGGRNETAESSDDFRRINRQ